MSKKKQVVRILVIVLVIALIADLALKLSVIIPIKRNEKDIISYELTEFEYIQKTPENPITENGVVFDNRFNVSKPHSDNSYYESEDGKIGFLVAVNNNVSEIDYLKEFLEEYSFPASLVFSGKTLDKYLKKNGIASLGEVDLLTFKDKKPLSCFSLFYPMPLFKQEALRGLLRTTCQPYIEPMNIYYSETDDYVYYIRETVSEKNMPLYYFSAYSKDDTKSVTVGFHDKANSLTREEAFDFFETFSFE